MITASADNSVLFPQLSKLNLGTSNLPSLIGLPAVTSKTIPPVMYPMPLTTAVDHIHSQQFAASRLPKLILPTFNRNPLSWLTFWDSFQAAILLNPDLSGVLKFNYLKGQLLGDAAQTIEGIPLCDQIYLHAVALLALFQDRFGHTHKLVTAHMQAFMYLFVILCKPHREYR